MPSMLCRYVMYIGSHKWPPKDNDNNVDNNDDDNDDGDNDGDI